MPDDEALKPTEPAPAAPVREVELPLDSWVRGGTTTSGYDNMLAAQHADAERRRDEQDRVYQASQNDPGAKLRSMKLGGSNSHPSFVFGIKHPKDNLILDWMICELSSAPAVAPDGTETIELTFWMECLRCVRTLHRRPEETFFGIQQSNRMWHLDERSRGKVWTDGNDTVVLAGSVTLDEWAHCPGLGCNWTFKIDGVLEANGVPCSGIIRTR